MHTLKTAPCSVWPWSLSNAPSRLWSTPISVCVQREGCWRRGKAGLKERRPPTSFRESTSRCRRQPNAETRSPTMSSRLTHCHHDSLTYACLVLRCSERFRRRPSPAQSCQCIRRQGPGCGWPPWDSWSEREATSEPDVDSMGFLGRRRRQPLAEFRSPTVRRSSSQFVRRSLLPCFGHAEAGEICTCGWQYAKHAWGYDRRLGQAMAPWET